MGGFSMDESSIKAYKIGDVAKILGISPDAMRYYEKMGIVKPYKAENNDYRYYEAWDINFIIECLWFKQFGFGMKEIAQMVSSISYDKLEDTLKQASQQLRQELSFQNMLLTRLEEQAHHLEVSKTALDQCSIQNSPQIVYYLNRHDYLYDDTPEIQRLSKQWLPYLSFGKRFFYTTQIGVHDALSWGFSMDKIYASELKLDRSPHVTALAPDWCIHSVFKKAGKYGISAQSLDYIVDYAREKGLHLRGSAYGQLLCSVCEDGEMTGYFEVWLPIQE